MSEAPTFRRLAAILAADVVGYSRMVAEDEAGTLAALRALWNGLFGPAVAAHRGRIAKMMGDGALVEFSSAVDAVSCAVSIQQALAERDSRIRLRMGINLGEIVIEGGDIFGEGVNVAARLEGRSPSGGVLVSDAVYAQVRGKVDHAFTDAGELELKNIEAPIRAWRWGSGVSPISVTSAPPASDTPQRPSIAVLPFTSLSADPEQEFFADGLVEDIITTLSKLSGLTVIARNSSSVYKGRAIDVREAARQLGVRYVLEGSVRKSATRIRITTQLIDARTGSHLWAERYDRAIDDIFAVQDEITLVLATEMQVRLTEGEQARLRYTTTNNIEAWTHWVRGLSHYREAVTKENTAAALACWRRALALDPASASLNAMVGYGHVADARFGWWEDRGTALEKARGYVDRALQLDPENADAHTMLAFTHLIEGRHDEAVFHIRRGVDLAPGSADAATYACFVLASCGHPEEAAAHGERAIALNPNFPAYYLGILGNAYRLSGRIDDAIAAFSAFHARSPGFGLVDLVVSYQQIGRAEEARRTAEQLLSIRPTFTIASWANTQLRADKEGLDDDIAALSRAGLPMN
jgi:adenylate cyclase